MVGQWLERNGKWVVLTPSRPEVAEILEVNGKDKIVRAVIGPAPDGNGWLSAVCHNWRDDIKSHLKNVDRPNREELRKAQKRAR